LRALRLPLVGLVVAVGERATRPKPPGTGSAAAVAPA
jgi:hypothetical protein